MWFGTGSLGIFRYDGVSVQWLYEEHLTQIEGGGSFGIRSILEDRNGDYWFCNTKYRYSILPGALPGKEPAFINYQRNTGLGALSATTQADRIYYQTIAEDSTGALWMQTYRDGIWRYDGRKMTHYQVLQGSTTVEVISLYQDKKGGLWLATQDKGIYRFNGTSFQPFTF